MKKRYKMVVFTNAAASLEREFNDWYSEHPLERHRRIKNFGRRGNVIHFTMNITDGPDLAPYLAIYDIETTTSTQRSRR